MKQRYYCVCHRPSPTLVYLFIIRQAPLTSWIMRLASVIVSLPQGIVIRLPSISISLPQGMREVGRLLLPPFLQFVDVVTVLNSTFFNKSFLVQFLIITLCINLFLQNNRKILINLIPHNWVHI